jgi:hypothetical protein
VRPEAIDVEIQSKSCATSSGVAPKETQEHSEFKGNADQLGMEVIGMLREVGVERFC